MGRGCAPRLACFTALLGASLSAGAAAPSAADFARCAAITASDARLACYDALAAPAPAPAAAPRAVPPAAAAPAPVTTTAAGLVSPSTGSVAAPVPVTAAAPAVPEDDARSFGLTAAQLHPVRGGSRSIQAKVTSIIQSRLGIGHPAAVLDNGQTWMFTEAGDDGRLSPGDTVTIKRAALGSYLMMTPSNHSFHVHRTQ